MVELGAQLEIARHNMLQAEGVVEQALARKAILQSNILDHSDRHEFFDTELPIEVGIFRVLPTTAAIEWQSPSGEFRLNPGQVYLDFHMPKADNLSNAKANESYTLIAKYLRSRPEITHIMGVTYRLMAMSGRKNQGFNIEEADLPEEIMSYASAYWQNMMPNAKPRQFNSAYLVWMDRDTFIDRFDGDTPFDQFEMGRAAYEADKSD